jgi:hypothetical protein
MICLRCGTRHEPLSSVWLIGPRRHWGVLGAPIRTVNVFRHRRSATPVPRTYLLGAGVGVSLGIVLDVLFGWPWWLVAAAFLIAVWLVFMSSALWGVRPHGLGHDLGTELLDAVSPARGRARRDRQVELLIRSPPFPLYGLPTSWTGGRFVGGYGGGDKARLVSNIELGHGDPTTASSPELRVQTAIPDNPEQLELDDLARSLDHTATRPPPDLQPEAFARWEAERCRGEAPTAEPNWAHLSIAVDGRPVRFHYLSQGDSWVARARAGDIWVTLSARNFPIDGIELVTVEDVEPYIAGWRAAREGHAHRRP